MAAGDVRKLVDDDSDVDVVATEEGIPLKSAREILGDLVIRAAVGNERIVLTRNGKQTAAIVGMRDLERLRTLDAVE